MKPRHIIRWDKERRAWLVVDEKEGRVVVTFASLLDAENFVIGQGDSK